MYLPDCSQTDFGKDWATQLKKNGIFFSNPSFLPLINPPLLTDQLEKLMLPADWKALALTLQGVCWTYVESPLLPHRVQGSFSVACWQGTDVSTLWLVPVKSFRSEAPGLYLADLNCSVGL